MHAHDILTTKGSYIACVRPEQTIREALTLLAVDNIGALIVSEHELLPLGIISERDIVRALLAGDHVLDQTVEEHMTRKIITVSDEADIETMYNTMTNHHIRHVPVHDASGLMIGLLSIGDVVKAHTDSLAMTRDALVMQTVGAH